MVKLKHNSFYKVLYLGLISIILTGCPHDVDDIQDVRINNDSDIELVFYKRYISTTTLDTLLSEDFPWANEISDYYVISPYTSKDIREVKSNLEHVLTNGLYQYFIFNYDSIKNIPWERIRDEYIVAKRVDFDTWEELEAADFTITYP